MRTPLGRTRLQLNGGKLDLNDHFLQRATDALSVIKISNSYLKSTLGTKNPDAKTLAALEMIEKSVLKVEAFVDSAKIEHHPIPHNKKITTTHKTIKKTTFALSELLQMTRPKDLPSDVKINLPKNDFKVFGNFYKLVVVISNLIENSIAAMKNQGVINIFAREFNDHVIIEVKDSGPGIPQNIINKVFSSLVTTKSGGNGLGLKMAKTIIDLHGGSIAVRNNPTTFTIKSVNISTTFLANFSISTEGFADINKIILDTGNGKLTKTALSLRAAR
jgi:signal transduction histidine kinase